MSARRQECRFGRGAPACLTSLLALAALIATVPAWADFLVVSNPATLKESPEREANVLLSLARGDTLRLLADAQTNRYYQAEPLDGGPAGWIYSTLARRHAGALPPRPLPSTKRTAARPGTLLELGGLPGVAPRPLTLTEQTYARRHLRLGAPRSSYTIVREGYAAGVDARLRIPCWVQYELRREDLDGPASRNNRDFRADTLLADVARAADSDYVGSRFDRGHLAPAEDMTRSDAVMAESFLLSNACPQIGAGFNNGVWKTLESDVRRWVQQRGALTIIAGPVFTATGDSVCYKLIGSRRVAVPTAFFKIIIDTTMPAAPDALAFLLPNHAQPGARPRQFLTSIDAIETATGLDLFVSLPDDLEQSLEEAHATQVWP